VFKISEFSRLSQISVKTLRYYDQLGLLKPAHTDPLSGYRYYTAEQLFRLNRILAFKELGFTLEQIFQALDEHLSPAQMRGMFRLKQAELQALIEREQARLGRIEEYLRLIEREGEIMAGHDVMLKSVKSQLVVSLHTRTSLSSLPLLFEEVNGYLVDHHIASPATLPHMVLWYSSDACLDDMDVEKDACDLEVACPLPKLIPESERVRVRSLPEISLMATVMHRCQPQSLCSANMELGVWIEQNHYALALTHPRREVYFSQGDDTWCVAEVQIPVEKA
jgi:DNA-binding transcriptional MerR regulator